MKKIVLFLFILIFSAGFFSGKIYQSNLNKKDECGVSKNSFTVEIQKTRFNPRTIRAIRCDKVTFVNKDDKLHSVVFGTHDNHVPYLDFAQEYLQPKERFILKLAKAGNYVFHDHLHEEIKGELIIKP